MDSAARVSVVPHGEQFHTVWIDIDAVRARLRTPDGAPATRIHVEMYLHSLGFIQTQMRGKYRGTPRAMAQLQPNELLSSKPAQT